MDDGSKITPDAVEQILQDTQPQPLTPEQSEELTKLANSSGAGPDAIAKMTAPIKEGDPTNVRSTFRVGLVYQCGGCGHGSALTDPGAVQHVLSGNRMVASRCTKCGVANMMTPAQDLLVVPKVVLPNRQARRAAEAEQRVKLR